MSQMLKLCMVSTTVRQLLERRQHKQKEYFYQRTRVLQKLQIGDSVRICKDGIWNLSQVTDLSDQPRSYVVQMPLPTKTASGRIVTKPRRLVEE